MPTPSSSSSRPSPRPESEAGGRVPAVAVIGAGYLGARVARAFRGPVVAVSRPGRWSGPCPAQVEPLALDITATAPLPDAARDALASCDRVVFCCAPGRTQDRRALYVEATARLLDRWPAALRRVVWVGSTSALPDHDGWLDERCIEPPSTERGRVQREAEAVVTEFAERRAVPWWVLRLGGLYGPGRGLDRIYRRRDGAVRPGDGMAATNLIHVDDATTAVLAALDAPAHLDGIVHVVDDDKTPRRHMYAAIARRLGQPPVTWAEPMPHPAVPRGKRVSNRRLKHTLGVRLRVPLHRFDEP